MNSDHERLELIRRYIDGTASVQEVQSLQTHLRSDPAFRRLFVRYANLDSALGDGRLASVSPVASVRQPPSSRWLSWRPIAAVAAGLIIGAFSATAVWAFASGSSPWVHERELPLVDGSFEQSAQVRQSRPLLKSVWHGDPTEVVGKWGRVSPHGGAQMLRFTASAIAEDERVKREAADMWQILDVPEGGPHRVRVRAWFAADVEVDTSFVVMATAMSCGLDEVTSAWGARFDGDPRVLSASVKTTIIHGSDPSWHLCEVLLEVPVGSRLLVLDVAGRKLPHLPAAEAFPAQFVDDVSVTIADEPAMP